MPGNGFWMHAVMSNATVRVREKRGEGSVAAHGKCTLLTLGEPIERERPHERDVHTERPVDACALDAQLPLSRIPVFVRAGERWQPQRSIGTDAP